MAAGLQTWDGQGQLTLNITDRLVRVLGSVYFPRFTLDSNGNVPSHVNGSLYNAMFSNGSPFYFFTPASSRTFYDGWGAPGPEVTFSDSGTTMIWNWNKSDVLAWQAATSGDDFGAGECYLNYGVY